jgi:hypothetical protein
MGMQRTDGMQRMDFETLVQTRKSVRGFTKERVARAVSGLRTERFCR